MSERITIDVVSEEDIWGNDYGQYQAYMLDVKTEDGRIVGNVKSNRKLKDDGSHNEPHEGEEVWGTLESQKGGSYKLTLDTKRMKDEPLSGDPIRSSLRSEASTGTSRPSSPKQETDWEVRNAEIRRQHSQGEAVQVLAHMGSYVMGDSTVPIDRLQKWIKEWADFFDQDAIAAGQKAQGGIEAASSDQAGIPDVSSSPQPSVDLSGARTEEPGPVDLDEYRQLLSSAGLEPAAARDKVSEYIAIELSQERAKKALSGLQDLERQGSVLAQLKTETEKWMHAPLPQGDALDGEEAPPF